MEIWQNLKKKRNTDYNFLPSAQKIVGAENNNTVHKNVKFD